MMDLYDQRERERKRGRLSEICYLTGANTFQSRLKQLNESRAHMLMLGFFIPHGLVVTKLDFFYIGLNKNNSNVMLIV